MSPRTNNPSEDPSAGQSALSSKSVPSKGSKRSEYIQQACITCRKRKVKCTGGASCAECNKLGERCHYADQRRKSRVQRNGLSNGSLNNANSNGSGAPAVPANLIQINTRLAELEAHCSRLKNFVSSADRIPSDASPDFDTSNLDTLLSTSRTCPAASITTSALSAPPAIPPLLPPAPPLAAFAVPAPFVPTPTSPSSPCRQALSPQQGLPPPPEEDSLSIDLPAVPPQEMISPPILATQSFNLDTDVARILNNLSQSTVSPGRPTPDRINQARAQQKVCQNNGAHFRATFHIFFRLLNPLHPVLNENQFRTQFDNLVFHNGQAMGELDRLQFLALVLLVYAEVSLLNSACLDPANVCGWDEFCTAEVILSDVVWKDTANLLTVQCLLIKTRYLTYLQRLHQAHDTMAIVVRICLSIGLHDKSRWALEGADPCEIVIRQRIFWSIFTLERCVSLSCGMPPILRATDCLVDLPPLFDDRSLFPNCPLPGETPELSFIPYLRALVSWGELWGEIWETMFSVRAFPTSSADRVASLDGKILAQINQLPVHLKWNSESAAAKLCGDIGEPWILRQRCMYITRMHALRLLIRQEHIHKAGIENQVAREITQIAGDSVRVMEEYIRSGGQAIDRYFLSTYLSALIIPLSCVIVQEDATPDLRQQAMTTWRRTVLLLEEFSWNFGVARLWLKRFESVIKAVGSVIVPSQTDGVANLEKTPNSPPQVASDSSAFGGGFGNILGTQNANEAISFEFSTPQFHGMASDPDLWRVITW